MYAISVSFLFAFHVSHPYNYTDFFILLYHLELDIYAHIFELHIYVSFIKDVLALPINDTVITYPLPY